MPIEKMKTAVAARVAPAHVATPNEGQCSACWRTVRPERRGTKHYCPLCNAEFIRKGDE